MPTEDSLDDSLILSFKNARISTLKKAAEISPLVKEVTIGPNSPKVKSEQYIEDISEIKESKKAYKKDDSSLEDLQYVKVMKNFENQRRTAYEEILKDLLQKMILKRSECMEKYLEKQSAEYEKRAREIRNRKLKMLREWEACGDKLLEQHYKSEIKYDSSAMENMNRILTEQNMAAVRFSSLTDSHLKICSKYNDIVNILSTNTDAVKEINDKYISTLNNIISNVNNLMDGSKSGTISDKDVSQAKIFVENMTNIANKIVTEVNEINKRKLIEIEHANRKKAIEEIETQKLTDERSVVSSAQAASEQVPLFYNKANYNHYKQLNSFLQEFEDKCKTLISDVNCKKFRFDCQKAVNTPVNAISSLSGSHIRDKFDKLMKLLRGERIQIIDSNVCASQHPQGLIYCTSLLAKKIVKQGDLLVSSNPEAAFPLASVTVALWSIFPDLGKLIEANFYRECPYIVPMLLPQLEGQSDQEFYKSRGYIYVDNVVEKQDKFLKRMSGIFRLQCAIWITKPSKIVNLPNPHGLSHAWRWLSSFLNLKPEPDICATLLFDFFTICGSECFKYYGKQFTKIIRLICTDYMKTLENIDTGGPKTRLEIFLQNVLKTGSITPPTGILSSNVW